jgi:D-glycero-D-manno-heptose 1,7-bisphosphate phosphatase
MHITMLERAVFLDRDNTIIENDGYLGDPSKVKLLPGAATALAAMRALGYRLIVVSNQSGVARGMFDENAVESVNQEMSRQLQEQGGSYIDASYYCPYHPEAPLPEYRLDHDWRKPKCGMLKQAATDFHLDLAQSWMIGDPNRDIGAGAAAGCRTILLKDPDRSGATETDLSTNVSPSFVVRTLADAARIIAREGRNPPPAPQAPAAKPAAPFAPSAAPEPASQSTNGATHAPEAPIAPAGGSTSALPRETSPASAVLAEESRADRLAHPQAVPAHPTQPAATSPLAGPTRLERSLDELIIQIRHQNRNADLREDFSGSDMLALLLQILAAGALIVGVAKFVRAPVNFSQNYWPEYFTAQMAREEALMWALIAIALQGAVIALLVRKRRK